MLIFDCFLVILLNYIYQNFEEMAGDEAIVEMSWKYQGIKYLWLRAIPLLGFFPRELKPISVKRLIHECS